MHFVPWYSLFHTFSLFLSISGRLHVSSESKRLHSTSTCNSFHENFFHLTLKLHESECVLQLWRGSSASFSLRSHFTCYYITYYHSPIVFFFSCFVLSPFSLLPFYPWNFYRDLMSSVDPSYVAAWNLNKKKARKTFPSDYVGAYEHGSWPLLFVQSYVIRLSVRVLRGFFFLCCFWSESHTRIFFYKMKWNNNIKKVNEQRHTHTYIRIHKKSIQL